MFNFAMSWMKKVTATVHRSSLNGLDKPEVQIGHSFRFHK